MAEKKNFLNWVGFKESESAAPSSVDRIRELESQLNDLRSRRDITTLSKDDIKDEINSLKEEVSSKLKLNLNESTDSELTNAIQSTIDKVNDAKCDHYNLYKLRKLNMGL
jgi:chromosome segregation ATPase